MSNPPNSPLLADPFFSVVPGTQWNACIGKQAHELNYLDGYIEAAIELVSAVIDKGMMSSRDTLVMPILYNTRHALELSLKFAISKLYDMGAIPSTHKMDHDILSHWKHLHSHSVGDRTVRELVSQIKPYVTSLAQIDEDGQELRYAETRSMDRSLNDFSVANLLLIRSSIEKLSALLVRLRDRIVELEWERETGSYTRDCSRRDLVEIAHTLGAHSSWNSESFIDSKSSIMTRFGLSSRKFSAAVDKIQSSRPLAALVGLETELTYLNEEKILHIMKKWLELHTLDNESDDPFGRECIDIDWTSMQRYFDKKCKVNQNLSKFLTYKEFAELEVLFYIGRDRMFGEFYDDYLKDTVRKYQVEEWTEAGLNHLISKTNLLICVSEGCTAVGQSSLAIRLSEMQTELPSVESI